MRHVLEQETNQKTNQNRSKCVAQKEGENLKYHPQATSFLRNQVSSDERAARARAGAGIGADTVSSRSCLNQLHVNRSVGGEDHPRWDPFRSVDRLEVLIFALVHHVWRRATIFRRLGQFVADQT